MRYYFKKNERFKLKKYDPARTRTWNLLIRSQTPYPLGHEAETGIPQLFENHLLYKDVFKVFFS